GNSQSRMEVDEFLFYPLRLLHDESGRPGGMGIQLTAGQSNVNFGPGIAGHELRIFQTKEIGCDAGGDVDRMPNRVGTESEAAFSSHFIQGIQAQVSLGIEDVRIAGVGGPQVDKLIQIIVAARQSQDRPHHEPCSNRSYSQTVGPGRTKNDICGFSPRSAFYEFNHHIGFSGDVFVQKPYKGPGLKFTGPSGPAAANYFDRFALVEVRLGERITRWQTSQ